MTCYYTLLGAEFPSLIGSLIPIIETAFSIGLVVGPFLGGLVNGYFGYTMTFVIFGSSLGFLGEINYMELQRHFRIGTAHKESRTSEK